MGLFSFAKNVGKKLFGASEAKAATVEELKKEIDSKGLPSTGVSIAVDGDKVSIGGNVRSQEEAERILLTIGNTIGVAQVETNFNVEKPAAEATMYTVKKGDTLWKIAEAHYGKGNGGKYPEIVKANQPPVENPDLIQPGWVLRIPPLA
jgi:nucleoid-associated protein YgaU